MRNTWTLALCLSFALAALGCGGGDEGGDEGGGAGGGDGGGAACNDFPEQGAGIPELAGTGTPPDMAGGTIEDGTYLLTSRFDYSGGTCECTTHGTWQISGGGTQLEAAVRTEPDPATLVSATIATSGTELVLTFTCPGPQAMTFAYTATATELTLWNPEKQQLETYTRQ